MAILLVPVFGTGSGNPPPPGAVPPTTEPPPPQPPPPPPPPVAELPPPAPPPPPPGAAPPLPRTSAYDTFRRAHREVVEEGIQFTDQVDACTEIGVADERAFRVCLDRAYAGVEADVRQARALAKEGLDTTSQRCRAALNSYLTVLDRYAAQLRAVRESASALRVDELTEGSKRLPGDQRRYIRFATNALLACAPA